VFDLLKKPHLGSDEITRIKSVALNLLQELKAVIERVDHWRDKEATRDAVYKSIHDFLYSDKTGLPVEAYTPEDVNAYTEEVFRHAYRAYPTVPSPFYSSGVLI
jgi:type I restriction enzyme R subunit